ncbi:hypothetical protein D9619_006848 [Psilocybe cf. subviscida]|uniref:F-box domain-containing protein n=1 Tax=Psilocybe cf. subviscida TaxID=2480587 RepID=A0A8H5EYA5_9AGAR|nr:hypothetical protein D9619_006848 [Psilocybe cf. subviscida]
MSLSLVETPETMQLQALVAASEHAANFLDPHLFKSSNRVLRAEEVTLVHNQIQAINEDIRKTDEILALARRTIEDYTAKRAHHGQCRRAYTALLSPLRTLPPEILCEIFAYSQLHSISARWTVSHVCQRWRQAALASPELWTNVVIPPTAPSWTSPNWGEIFRYEGTCLERAKGQPTKWYFRQPLYGEYDRGHGKRGHFKETMLRMVGRAPCSEVSFEAEAGEQDPVFFGGVLTELIKSSATTLKVLFITSSRMPLNLLSRLASFSQLSGLSVSRFPYSDDIQVGSPWLSLTKLSIAAERIQESVMTRVLQNTPNLEALAFKIAVLDRSPDPHELFPWTVTLVKLKSLSLESTNGPLYEYIDHNISASELCDLRIYGDKTPCLLSKLLLFTTGCQNTLRRLWVSGLAGYELRSMAFLGMKKLEELAIHMKEDIRPLDDLVVMGDQDFFPSLTMLRVICTAGDEFRRRFLDVVESRGWDGCIRKKGVQLRHAHLHADVFQATKNVWTLDDANIRQLRNRGLDLIVQTPVAGADRPSFLT